MVFKATLIHCRWSYGKGDDQYDSESIGSTKNAVNLEKSVKKLKKNKKNEYDEKMCSRQEAKHTNDQGWTTIDANSKHKPKSTNSKHTTINSIISSIDIEFNIDTNGTLEAKIVSPVQKNHCTTPDTIDNHNEMVFKPNSQRQRTRTLTPPMLEEENKETLERI
jgi:hypothetical protein